MSFAATWMDLEIIISSEVRQKEKYCDITYIWNLKKMIQINLFTKQKQTHRHRKKTYCYQRGWVRETNQEFGINIYNLLYLKWVNKGFLYSTGNYPQCFIINFNGKRI